MTAAPPFAKLILSILFIAACAQVSNAQRSGRYLAIDVGIGLNAGDNFGAVYTSAALSLKPSTIHYSVRFSQFERIQNLFSFVGPAPDLDRIREVALLAGISELESFGRYGLVAGPSIVIGNHNQLRNRETFTAVGLAIQGWGMITISKHLGFGLKMDANLNHRRTFGGAAVMIEYIVNAAA